MAILYFYTVKQNGVVRYEGGSYPNAVNKLKQIMEWIQRNSKPEEVSFTMRPFQERELGGSPQHV